ncbi:MAG TPA: DUF481 domain-containing protein [Gemmatimonadales bacterium]|jgi:hypothetical protein
MLALLTLLAFGRDSTPKVVPKAPPVKITADAGFVSATGNTSVQTLNLGDKFSARVHGFTFSQQFGVVHGSSGGETVASSWQNLFRTDMVLHADVGAYASVTVERNVLSGVSSRVGTVTGLSAQLLKTKTDRLVLEGGVSITSQRGTDANAEDQDFLGGRAATSFTHQIGPRASIGQSLEVLPNFREGADLRINTETSLLAPFTHRAAVKLTYVIHYDGVPEPGFLSTDRLFTSGIQVTL